MENELIQERLSLLGEEYKTFLGSDYLSTLTESLSVSENLTPEETTYLQNGIVLFLLFFIDAERLKNFIAKNCNREEEAAGMVEVIMQAMPDWFPKVYNATYPIFFEPLTTPAVQSVTPEPMYSENTNPLVRPLPQSPYAEVPTYQSSQADLYPIRKRPGADDPKWGA